jgi:hypothetical protein
MQVAADTITAAPAAVTVASASSTTTAPIATAAATDNDHVPATSWSLTISQWLPPMATAALEATTPAGTVTAATAASSGSTRFSASRWAPSNGRVTPHARRTSMAAGGPTGPSGVEGTNSAVGGPTFGTRLYSAGAAPA